MSELFAGWSQSEITPPLGLPLAGYIARRETASGVLAPLFVRALVLQQGHLTVGIIVADLLLISNRWAAWLRRRLSQSLDIERENIIVAATHTHSGPLIDTSPFHSFSGGLNSRANYYMRSVEQKMDLAVSAAAASLKPVRVTQTRVLIRDVASDRNHPALNRKQPLFLMRFENTKGVAILGAFGCHSTVLGADNTLISGDLHGEICRRMETRGDFVLIANGAAANISTRFTRREQTPTELVRLSSSVVEQLAQAHFRRVPSPKLLVVEKDIRCPIRNLKRAVSEGRQKSGRLAVVAEESQQTLALLRHTSAFKKKSVVAPVTVVRLGKVCLAALPFEIYSDTGEFLCRKAQVVPICYANGYLGYVPSPAAAIDDYEAVSSPFDCRTDALLRKKVTRIASRLRRGDNT